MLAGGLADFPPAVLAPATEEPGRDAEVFPGGLIRLLADPGSLAGGKHLGRRRPVLHQETGEPFRGVLMRWMTAVGLPSRQHELAGVAALPTRRDRNEPAGLRTAGDVLGQPDMPAALPVPGLVLLQVAVRALDQHPVARRHQQVNGLVAELDHLAVERVLQPRGRKLPLERAALAAGGYLIFIRQLGE